MGIESKGPSDQGIEKKDHFRSQEDTTPDYEKMDIEIFDPNTDSEFQEWLEKNDRKPTASTVADYVEQELSSKFHLPDVRYKKYLLDSFKSNTVPQKLSKDIEAKTYYLFGTLARDPAGGVHIPWTTWHGMPGGWSNFDKDDSWTASLGFDPGKNRVVLLLKEEVEKSEEA